MIALIKNKALQILKNSLTYPKFCRFDRVSSWDYELIILKARRVYKYTAF